MAYGVTGAIVMLHVVSQPWLLCHMWCQGWGHCAAWVLGLPSLHSGSLLLCGGSLLLCGGSPLLCGGLPSPSLRSVVSGLWSLHGMGVRVRVVVQCGCWGRRLCMGCGVGVRVFAWGVGHTHHFCTGCGVRVGVIARHGCRGQGCCVRCGVMAHSHCTGCGVGVMVGSGAW
jgi:hypothetical protein